MRRLVVRDVVTLRFVVPGLAVDFFGREEALVFGVEFGVSF